MITTTAPPDVPTDLTRDDRCEECFRILEGHLAWQSYRGLILACRLHTGHLINIIKHLYKRGLKGDAIGQACRDQYNQYQAELVRRGGHEWEPSLTGQEIWRMLHQEEK